MEAIIVAATDLAVENAEGTQYAAVIHGKRWSGITAKSNMWASVQKAIDEGVEVLPFLIDTLAHVKAKKINMIDTKTAMLIRSGFSFANKRFSMSEAAQRNWTGIVAAQALGAIPYPCKISTADEGPHTLDTVSEGMAFILAYLTYQTDGNAPLGQGRALKARVEAATTKEAVEAITDDRQ